ncbi:MAG: amino acid permease [Sphingobacteriales bacterium JAD_PAG50586_3]|nr:MAG: amino acid permease [Sphingobacteriales bacterium JAD_PAG50586_3]
MQKNKVGLSTGIFLVMGSMIGSGVYIVSAGVAQALANPLLLILVWITTGILTVIAATSYAELSAMFPKSGGQYVYLKEAFNPLMGFLYGWSLFAVIQTGTIAAVAVAFAKFTAVLVPWFSADNILFQSGDFTIHAGQLLAVASIALLTFINSRGIQYGAVVQSSLTIIKALTLILLIIATIFIFSNAEAIAMNFQNFFSIDKRFIIERQAVDGWTVYPPLSAIPNYTNVESWSWLALLSAFGAAMVGPLFSSDAWNGVTFIAGEMENPKKNVARSLIIGVGGVTLLYVLTNLGYLFVLPMWGTEGATTLAGRGIQYAEYERVGTAAMQVMLGASGAIVMAVLIMISTFGANNGIVLSGARVYQTMANDGLFFKKMGNSNKQQVPGFSLWVQCLWASLLCLSGKYGDLLDYVMFVVILFYILTIAGLFILRFKQPKADRPYKAFGYPVLPALYIIAMICFIVNLLIVKPEFTVPGLIIVLTGIPVYYIWKYVNSRV